MISSQTVNVLRGHSVPGGLPYYNFSPSATAWFKAGQKVIVGFLPYGTANMAAALSDVFMQRNECNFVITKLL